MRSRRVATALVVLATGLAASAAVRRFVSRRRSVIPSIAAPAAPAAPAPVAAAAPAPVAAPAPALPAAADSEAVVLPFARRVEAAPAPERKAGPARCGDTGGRTKAGAPCGALALSGGRCRHHRLAA